MNVDRAKEILSAFREGIDSPDSPEFYEAFRLLEVNDELANWFFEDKQFDQSFGSKLKTSEPPEGLKDKIFDALDEKFVSDKLDELSGCGKKKICFSLPKICLIHWLGLATVFVMLGLLYFSVGSSKQISNPKDFVYQLQSHLNDLRPSSLGYYNEDISLIKKKLLQNSDLCEKSFKKLTIFNDSRGIGCLHGTLGDYEYAFVSFIKSSRLYHVYVFNNRKLSMDGLKEAPFITQSNIFTYALWEEGNHFYALVAREPKTQLYEEFFSFSSNY